MPDPIPAALSSVHAEQQEEEFVHSVYDAIADHFSQTRYKPWPVVERFLQSLQSGALGVDVGCGNGKYLGVRKDVYLMGSDRCEKLVGIARQRGHESMRCDNLSLPYRDQGLDFALSIAVIHHFTSPERRLLAIKELLRVLRPGGQLLIFVWAIEQSGRRRFDPQQPDVLVPWVTKSNQTASSDGTDEGEAAQVYQRYYHLFTQGELDALVQSIPCTSIVESGYDRDNWYLIVRKEEE